MKKALLLLTMAFIGLSNAFGGALTFLSEDFESGQIPATWTQEVLSSNVANWAVEATATASYPSTGNNSQYFASLRNLTGEDMHYRTRLISPAINFVTMTDVNEPQLVFNHAQVGYGSDFDTLKVYYRVNANAPWTLLRSFDSRIEAWTMDTIALTGFMSASAYQIAFEAVENMGRGIVLDDIRILNTSRCQNLSTFNVVTVGATYATLEWYTLSMPDTFELVLSKKAVTNWDTDTLAFQVFTTDFEYTFNNLEHSTTYYAYARMRCRDNDTGWTDWSENSFHTRTLADLPYMNMFTSTRLPEGWMRATNMSSAKPTFSSGATYSVDSTYAMVFSSVTAGKYAIAVTPQLNVPSLQGVEVSFWGYTGSSYIRTPYNSNISRMYVGVMDDPDDSTSLVIIDSVEMLVANKHQRFEISLANYTGNGRFIAFVVSNEERAGYFYVSNLTITQPAVFTPTGVQIKNATPDGFDVQVDLHGASAWNLRVARGSDYKHKGVLPSSFLVSQDGLTGNSYHVNGQFGDSIVTVYVQGVKNGALSAWSFPATQRIPARATLPLRYEFQKSGDATVLIREFDHEIASTSTSKTFPGLYFDLKDFSNFYPKASTSTPKYDSAHVLLQGTHRHMTLPYIDSFANQMLTFRLAAASAGQSRVAVGIMVDPYDLSTFTQLAVFDGGNGTYDKCEVELDGVNAAGHYVAFVALEPANPSSSYGSVNHIDAIHIETIPSCREAVNPQVAVDVNSAVITWDGKGMQKWEVELFSGSKPDSLLSAVVVTSATASFAGLDSVATYYYRINTICGNDTVIGEDKHSFRTPNCVPYAENFNGITSGIPAGWDNSETNISTASYRWSYYATGFEGKCLRFNSFSAGNGTYDVLAMPAVKITRAAMLKFMWKNPTGGPAKVLISTDGGATRSVLVDSVDLEEVVDWTEIEANLIPYLGQTVNIYFRSVSNYGSGDAYHYLDNVRIDDAPSCMKPRNLTISNVTATTANVSWVAQGTENQWQYLCVAVGDSADWSQAQIVRTPSVTLTNLGGCSSYTVYVRAYCSSSDQSTVISKSFSTAEGAIATLPWVESFEGYEGGQYNSTSPDYVPTCWNTYSTGSVAPHVISSGSYLYVHSGAQALSFYGSGYCTAELPEFARALNTLKISFWYRTESASNGTLKLGYIEANDSSFHEIATYSANQTFTQQEKLLIDLPATATRLAFQWYYSGQWSCCVDDIVISAVDLNCTGLASLRASAGSATQASILWTAGGTQSIDIEVSDSANFAGATQYLNVTANPFILNDLEQNHTYYVRAHQSCDQSGQAVITTSFKTLCDAVSPEDFAIETFQNPGNLDCWVTGVSTPGVRTTADPSISSSTGLGKYLAFVKSATSSDTITYGDGLYAIMPELAIDSINGYEVSFNACKTSSDTTNYGRLAVGVLTDPADLSTFTAMQTIKLDYAADSTEMKSYTVNFKNYRGDYNDDYGKYIMFLAQAGDYATSIALDNVEISVLSSCPRILEGSVSNIGENSAVYRWDANGASAYEVVVLTSAGNPSYSDELPVFQATVTGDSVVLSDLSAATFYYAYVRAICGDEQARWSAHTRFQTACGVISNLPWNEGFEDYDGGSYNSKGDQYHPLCWNTYADQSVVPHIVTSGSYVAIHSGEKALAFYGVGNCYAELPEFSVPLNQLSISFWARYESTSNGTMYLGYFMPNDSSFYPILSCTPSHTEYRQYEVNLDTIPEQATRLAFRYYSASTTNWNACIDDIVISLIPSCKPLGSLAVKEVSRRTITVEVAPKAGDTLHDVELVCSERPLSATGLDSVAKISIDTLSEYTITDLIRETRYYIYARVNCGGENGASEWLSVNASTMGLYGCDDMQIVGTDSAYSSSIPTNSYYNYTVSEQIYTPEEIGKSGKIGSIAFYNIGTEKTRDISVYLLHTNKSEFSSTTDWVNVTASDLVFSGEVTFEVEAWATIPVTNQFEYNGTDNLLVVVDDNTGSYSQGLSCVGFFVESNQAIYKYQDSGDLDPTNMTIAGTLLAGKNQLRLGFCYQLDVCPTVGEMSSELVGAGTSQAIVRWEASEGDYLSGYDVIFSDSVISDFTGIAPTYPNIQVDSVALNGLNPETSYYVYVRAICMAEGHDEGMSDWKGISFTTLANCPAVVDLFSELTDANSARVAWLPAFAEQELRFAYVLSTDTMDAAALASAEKVYINDTLAFDLVELAFGQRYHVYVASVCGEAFSPWSETTFTTVASCAPVSNLVATRIAHNRINLEWTRSQFGTENQWQVGIIGDTAHVIIVSDTAAVLSAMLIGLEPETSYTAYVRALCGDGEVSEMAIVPFTTRSYSGGCIVVADDIAGSSYSLPFDNWYKNAWTQTIYTAEEIGQGGLITSISYHCDAAPTTAFTQQVTIYMGHTTNAVASSNSDWVALADLDVVYTNVAFVHPVDTGWVQIELDEPFLYDGTNNLAVVMSTHCSNYNSSLKYSHASGPSGVSLYRNNDSDATYGDHPGTATGTSSSDQPTAQFCFVTEAGCAAVTALKATGITSNEASFSWEPMGNERSWHVFLADTIITDFSGIAMDTVYNYSYSVSDLLPDKDYRFYVRPTCGGETWRSIAFTTEPICSAPINLHAENIMDESALLAWEDAFSVGSSYIVAFGRAATFSLNDTTTYRTLVANDTTAIAVEGLTAMTSYSFAVKAICSSTLSSRYSEVFTFKTECAMGSLPFFESFNGLSAGIPDCWDNSEGTTTTESYKWNYFATGYDGAGLRFDSYLNTSGNTNILATPAISLTENAMLTFQWKNPTGGDAEIFISTDGGYTRTSIMSTGLTGVADWTEMMVDLTPYTGQVVHIYFEGTSNYGYGDAYLYLDDVRVGAAPTCFRPSDVTFVSADADSASFTWTASSTGSQWQYVCVPFGTTPDWTNAAIVDTTFAVVHGLPENASYDFYVRTYCSADDQSDARYTTFATACGIIASLPWREGFEAYDGGSYSSSAADYAPTCWETYSDGYGAPHVVVGGSYAYVHTGSKALCLYGGDTCVAEMPKFAAPLNTLKLSFWYTTYSSTYGDLVVGYISSADSAFHAVAHHGPSSSYVKVDVLLNTLPADAARLVFLFDRESSSSSNTCCIDDITIDTLNLNCAGIVNLHASQVSLSGATIEWSYAGGSNDAFVQIATDAAFANIIDSALVRNAASYVITGLQASSTFFARVRQVCGGGDFSEWTDAINFSTGYGLPYIPEVDANNPRDWFFSNTAAADVFAGTEMASHTPSGYSGWTKVEADSIITANHFHCDLYGTSCHYWMVTPAIDMTPNLGQGVVLSFEAAMVPYSSTSSANMYTGDDDRFLVVVSADGGNTWNPADVTEWNNAGTGDFVLNDVPTVGQLYRINLSNYAGQVVKVGFYGESTASNADNWFNVGKIRIETVETTNYFDTICEGNSFVDHGFTVPYTDLHVGMNVVSRYEMNTDGTMSLTIQQIWVVAASINEIPVTLCEGEHFNGYGFDITATVSQNIRRRVEGGNIYGCDSTVILKVTVNPTVRTEQHIGVNGDSYTFKGKTYYQSTVIYDTTSAVTGCDSITTIYLTFCEGKTYNYHNVFCAGSSYSDEFFQNLTAPGKYSGTAISEIGCETHANLTLHELPVGQNFVDTVLVKDLPYVLGNDTLCPETDQPGFVYHGSKDFGCGMVNVTIYVEPSTDLNNVVAGTLQVAPNPVAVGEDIRILSSIDRTAADYTCRVFDAVGKLAYETTIPSDVIPGLHVAGAYTVRITSGNTIYQAKLIVK